MSKRFHLRVLRGPVKVTFSERLLLPTYHLDPECKGLENVPAEARAQTVFEDAWTLGRDEDSRMCRMCTLEAVLRTVTKTRRREESRLVTFASVPTHERSAPTSSGQARVRRLARFNHMATTTLSQVGTVAWGAVNEAATPILADNLVCLVLDEDTEPSTAAIETFWSLAADDLGQLAPKNRHEALETWHAARLLTA